MPNLIINTIDVTGLLEEKLARLSPDWVVLLQTPVEETLAINTETVKILQSFGYDGIYVTFTKDYLELSSLFGQSGIDVTRLSFIDGVSRMYGVKQVASAGVVYIPGPLSIENVSENLLKLIPNMKSEKRFVFLDSITTVLLYNSLERTLEFHQTIITMLKKMNVVGVVVFLVKGFVNQKLVDQLSSAANETIDLSPKV